MKYVAPSVQEVEVLLYDGSNLTQALEFIGSKALVDYFKVIFVISQGHLVYFPPNSFILKQGSNFSVSRVEDLVNLKKL